MFQPCIPSLASPSRILLSPHTLEVGGHILLIVFPILQTKVGHRHHPIHQGTLDIFLEHRTRRRK